MPRVQAAPIVFTVWSDVLCPWCYNLSVCLERVREDVTAEFGDVLQIRWKSFLLRPYPEPKPFEKFRRYTESWNKPAAQADAGEFCVWATDQPPPSHSVPPAVAVKAAARQGAFDRYHRALMHAYFARNLDVTDVENITAIAAEQGLDADAFARDFYDADLVREVIADHNEAVEAEISGVPCVVLESGFPIPGSQDRAVYRNVIGRLLRAQEEGRS